MSAVAAHSHRPAGLTLDLVLFVVGAMCLPTCICGCLLRLARRVWVRGFAAVDEMSRAREGDTGVCRVHLELIDGRAASSGLLTKQLRTLSLKQLVTTLSTAYRSKLRAQPATPFFIYFLDKGGEWEELTQRAWFEVRDEIANLRVLASTVSTPRSSSRGGGYAPVSSR